MLVVGLAVSLALTFSIGHAEKPNPNVGGTYDLTGAGTACLPPEFSLEQSGQFVTLKDEGETHVTAKLRLSEVTMRGTVAWTLRGTMTCPQSGTTPVELRPGGKRWAQLRRGSDVVATLTSVQASPDALEASSVAGVYQLVRADSCLGALGASLTLTPAGTSVSLTPTTSPSGVPHGNLHLTDETLSGHIACADRDSSELKLRTAVPRLTDLRAPEGELVASWKATSAPTGCPTSAPLSPEAVVGRLMLAIAVVILAARLMGALAARVGQPLVMGEVIAGILLGPTLVGRLLPRVSCYLFPPQIIPLIGAAASVGLVFYMFLVGLELDPSVLKGRATQAAFISNASVMFPMALGIAAALPIFRLLGESDFGAFALFMGVSMSVTAFPVLARILVERRMLKSSTGVIALACAAVDDVTAWGLLALASAVALSQGSGKVVSVVALSIVFCLAMALVVRRFLARVSQAYDEAGSVPTAWIAAIFVAILLAAYVSTQIGIAAIFGAFVVGLIMPRRADLSHDVTRRIEDFVVTVLLPLFFVVTGLRTDIGRLERPVLWLITLLLIVIAVAGKFAGATLAARYSGYPWRRASAIGALMNTRGLTELIVLNIGLDLGIVTPALFTMLVIMALVTTLMTGPALRLIDRRGDLSAGPVEELRQAQRAPAEAVGEPTGSILVAPMDEGNFDALLALAEPLARSSPPRELILARLLVPKNVVVLGPTDRELGQASKDLDRRRRRLISEGIAARGVTFTSPDRGADLVRLASEHEVDLLLIDGRRPLIGEAIPRGPVGVALDKASCDVAVLVAPESTPPQVDSEHPVIVPFGGAEHDWAALELGAWVASSYDASLVLLGSVEGEGRDASRLLADAALVVQQLVGVPTEPRLIAPGRSGVLEASEGAGLLAIGLSERWRREGLGPVRADIARTARVPTLFARRGSRPGALAPSEDLTRFTWSVATPPTRG